MGGHRGPRCYHRCRVTLTFKAWDDHSLQEKPTAREKVGPRFLLWPHYAASASGRGCKGMHPPREGRTNTLCLCGWQSHTSLGIAVCLIKSLHTVRKKKNKFKKSKAKSSSFIFKWVIVLLTKGRRQLPRKWREFGLADGKVHFVRRLRRVVWIYTRTYLATRNIIRNDFAEINRYKWEKPDRLLLGESQRQLLPKRGCRWVPLKLHTPAAASPSHSEPPGAGVAPRSPVLTRCGTAGKPRAWNPPRPRAAWCRPRAPPAPKDPSAGARHRRTGITGGKAAARSPRGEQGRL